MEGSLMDSKRLATKAIESGNGIMRLAPTWVPRTFSRPGKRLKLHPDDYYRLGLERGGICERWLASTVHADNGPQTPDDEGLSYVVVDAEGKERIQLREVVAELKDEAIGAGLWRKYGRWPMFAKFFDNLGPLPHHIHQDQAHAALVGLNGKPEMYFFPAQLNSHGGEFPFTFFGFNPDVTREQVRECLKSFSQGDNKILDLSRAYKQILDTGWDVPAGILHAPGSLLTYEPQMASDVLAMYQSVLYGEHCVSEDLVWQNAPKDRIGDVDYLMEIIDWDQNVDPDFHRNHFMRPLPVRAEAEMVREGYIDEWIGYQCDTASAKRLTVLPGGTVIIKEAAAYGLAMLQGHGTINDLPLETPTLIRYGQLTYDEYFVTIGAAQKGVTIKNMSSVEPLVMLKHFAGNAYRSK
jgi:hypothetical protein